MTILVGAVPSPVLRNDKVTKDEEYPLFRSFWKSKAKNIMKVLLFNFFAFTLLFLNTSAYAVKIGEKVPEFYLRDYNGTLYYSRDFCGPNVRKPSILIIDFFATWCEPCKRSAEIFKKLYLKYNKKGLKVLLISFQEKEGRIRKFAEGNNIPFPILMDKYGDMAKIFKVYGLPRTFILKNDCTLKREIIGELQNLEEELEKEIKSEGVE